MGGHVVGKRINVKTNKKILPLLLILLVLTICVSLTIGKYPLGLTDIGNFFLLKLFKTGNMDVRQQDLLSNLLFDIRLPRILAAALIGASLSVAGASFQAMFVNPLVSPSLLGVLAGASFGAALGMVFSGSWFAVQCLTFFFGFLAVGIAVGIAKMHKGNTILLLILGGVISGAMFTSLLSVIKYIADPANQLPAIVQWLMGGLSLVDYKTLLAAGIPQLVSIALVIIFSGYLNALSMGDEEARALGVAVERIRLFLIFLATLMSALTVVIAGMIGWVGLIIPHILRLLVGPDHRLLIPTAFFTGGAFLVVADTLARCLVAPAELPVGVITALCGAPYFLLLLRRRLRLTS